MCVCVYVRVYYMQKHIDNKLKPKLESGSRARADRNDHPIRDKSQK